MDNNIKESCDILGCELPEQELTINIDVLVDPFAIPGGVATGTFVPGRAPTTVTITVRGRTDKEASIIAAHEATHAACKLGICVAGIPLPVGVSEGVAILTTEPPDRILSVITELPTLSSEHLFTTERARQPASSGNGASLMAYLILLGGQEKFNKFLQAGGARAFDESLIRDHYGFKDFDDLNSKWARWHLNHKNIKDWEATIKRLKEEMTCPSIGKSLSLIDEIVKRQPGAKEWGDTTRKQVLDDWGTWTREQQKNEMKKLQDHLDRIR